MRKTPVRVRFIYFSKNENGAPDGRAANPA
jgi:hypothetical protein